MIGLYVYIILCVSVGTIVCQEVVVAQVLQTKTIKVIFNTSKLNETDVSKEISVNISEPHLHMIKNPEMKPGKETVPAPNIDMKSTRNEHNLSGTPKNKTEDSDKSQTPRDLDLMPEEVGNGTVKTEHKNDTTNMLGTKKPNSNTTDVLVSFDNRTGVNGDGCPKGFEKVNGVCVEVIK